MYMMSLITLIQDSHGSPIILKKILNSAAYKESSLEEQANILRTIIVNSQGNSEVLISVVEELQLKLHSRKFFKSLVFFDVLISLIKSAHENSRVLMWILSNEYRDICSYMHTAELIGLKQIQEFFITIAENANGNIEILKKVFERTVSHSDINNSIKNIIDIILAIITSANGNIEISEKILQSCNQGELRHLINSDSEQYKNILAGIANTVVNLELSMIEKIINLAKAHLEASHLKEILTIMAKRVNKDIVAITKIIDFAHEYLATKEQKDLLIELVEMTNRDPEVVKIVMEQAQYLSIQYSYEILKCLDTQNTKSIDEHNREIETNISDLANELLLSFTSASSGNMPEVEENKAIQRETQDEDLKVECKRPRYV